MLILHFWELVKNIVSKHITKSFTGIKLIIRCLDMYPELLNVRKQEKTKNNDELHPDKRGKNSKKCTLT